MPKIRTLFCLVDIKKRSFLTSSLCVFVFSLVVVNKDELENCAHSLVWRI